MDNETGSGLPLPVSSQQPHGGDIGESFAHVMRQADVTQPAGCGSLATKTEHSSQYEFYSTKQCDQVLCHHHLASSINGFSRLQVKSWAIIG